MNSLERILRATRLEPVDRTPLVPQLFGHAAVCAGLSLRDYLHDGEALAHAQIRARERYRTDAVFAFLVGNPEKLDNVSWPLPPYLW